MSDDAALSPDMGSGVSRMTWNPELVARLEAERAQPPPRRPRDTPDDIAKRRQLAEEIATYSYRKKA
jgi:hypothetical protein